MFLKDQFLIFILFINDFPINDAKYDTIIYADDIVISFPINIKNPNNITHHINIELNNIYNWISKSDLILNTSKTYFTVFKNISNKINIKSFKFTLNNSPIAYKKNIKYLGIIFDTNLYFKSHINYLIPKLYKVKSTINFLRHTYKINRKTLINYYNALFYFKINYCNSIWASNYKTNVKKIQTLQNLTIRTIYNYSYDEHINYNKLKLLDIKKLNTLRILTYIIF